MRSVLAANSAMLALGNERFEAAGATFVRNRSAPLLRDNNHVEAVTAGTPEEVDALLARAEREFAGFPQISFVLDPFTPPELEARLAMAGYQRSLFLAMVLEGELRGTRPAAEIRPVAGEEAWEAYAVLGARDVQDWVEKRGTPAKPGLMEQLMLGRRLRANAMSFWLAYAEGRPAAYLCSWVAPNGIGQVEDLFTHPDFRHRGLATALLHHGVAHCRSLGAREVFLIADPDDTPKQMYAALGFRPLAVIRTYWSENPA